MKRNKFSLSCFRNLTCNMGELVPIGLTEIYPGDSIQHATSLLVRTSPLLAPVMHPVHVRIHHWYVPTRLVWDDWEEFITGGSDGNNASTFPTITPNTGSGYAVGSLADYLGVPTGVDDLPHSAIPFRMYARIWNEWYRDENLQTELTVDTTDGADTTTSVTLQNVCWEKDYFTSSRTATQLGTQVTIPIGTSAPVIDSGSLQPGLLRLASSGAGAGAQNPLESDASNRLVGADGTTQLKYDPNGTLIANLAAVSGTSINDLRYALAIQRYMEARMRYGNRYPEYLRYLGVRSSDARLQRCEYLGGGKQTIQFSEVLQTGVTTSGTPATGVGSMLGHGVGAVRSNRYRRFFEEHGYVMTLLSVLPKTMYVNGLPRHWSYTTKVDFWQKELEHVGQQAVLNKEVYWAHATPNGTFGYQDRYDHLRRAESTVHGDFRSTTLNYWHLARIFASDPSLNSTFVGANPATRIYQSTSTDQLIIMAMHSMQARRLMSAVGTSSIL